MARRTTFYGPTFLPQLTRAVQIPPKRAGSLGRYPYPRRALPDAADWGPARSSLVEGAEPSRIRPVFPGCQRDQLGRWWVTFASRCWRSIAGTLSPSAMSAPWLSPGQLYRLLLIALQLALASNPVQISTRSQTGIPPAPEWFNRNHQAASPDRSAGNPSVGFG